MGEPSTTPDANSPTARRLSTSSVKIEAAMEMTSSAWERASALRERSGTRKSTSSAVARVAERCGSRTWRPGERADALQSIERSGSPGR
jgi:hypothetical protein